MFDFRLEDPWWLLLLLVLPVVARYTVLREQQYYAQVKLSNISQVLELVTVRVVVQRMLPWLRLVGIALLIVAMARPQVYETEENLDTEGIDILLVLDVSSSMLSRDFEPNRLEVIKTVAKDFVEGRSFDRFGMVAYAAEPYTAAPLTTDRQYVTRAIASLEVGVLDDGTAIGMGLATAVERLRRSDTKSKIIILLTDGENNAGYVNPMQAAEIAAEYDFKVYTIGVGSNGFAESPVRIVNGEFVYGITQVVIDEQLLTDIAEATGGRYFRATSERALREIYDEIDLLETSAIERTVVNIPVDVYYGWLLVGIVCIVTGMALQYTLARSLP